MKFSLLVILLAGCGEVTDPPADSSVPDSYNSLQVTDSYIPQDRIIPYCGNGHCDPGETMTSCFTDCRPKPYNNNPFEGWGKEPLPVPLPNPPNPPGPM